MTWTSTLAIQLANESQGIFMMHVNECSSSYASIISALICWGRLATNFSNSLKSWYRPLMDRLTKTASSPLGGVCGTVWLEMDGIFLCLGRPLVYAGLIAVPTLYRRRGTLRNDPSMMIIGNSSLSQSGPTIWILPAPIPICMALPVHRPGRRHERMWCPAAVSP